MEERNMKRKIGMDLNDNMHSLLSEKREAIGNSSLGDTVNQMIDAFINVPRDVMASIAHLCLTESAKIKNELSNTSGMQAYESLEKKEKLKSYEKILKFITNNGELLDVTDKNLSSIKIKNGKILYPGNWRVFDVFDLNQCLECAVIEVRNGDKYNLPHILVPLPKHVTRISRAEEDHIYEEIAKKYPEFKQMLSDVVQEEVDDDGRITNGEQYLSSPRPGMFAIPDSSRDDFDLALGFIVRDYLARRACL